MKTETSTDLVPGVAIVVDPGVEVIAHPGCRRCGAKPSKLRCVERMLCDACVLRREQGTRSPSRRVVAVSRSKRARGEEGVRW